MTDEATRQQEDATDAVAAFVRTAEVLANSGVSMLDIAGAMTALLVGAIGCLPEPMRAVARREYSGIVAHEPKRNDPT